MTLTVKSNAKSWWARLRRDAIIKTATGETEQIVCLAGFVSEDKKRFRFECHEGPGFALLLTGKVTEIYVDRAWYKVSYQPGFIGGLVPTLEESARAFKRIMLDCEPIPGRTDIPNGTGVTVNNKPSVKDQILDALRSVPEGLTARQIGEKVDCGKQWVFSNLAHLMRTGKVEKLGTLYRAA